MISTETEKVLHEGFLAARRLRHRVIAVEEKSKPRQELLDTQKRLEPLVTPLRLKYVLDNRQAAHAAAVATAMAIRASRQHLNPKAGFGLAAFSFAEGSQTLPAEIGKAGNADYPYPAQRYTQRRSAALLAVAR